MSNINDIKQDYENLRILNEDLYQQYQEAVYVLKQLQDEMAQSRIVNGGVTSGQESAYNAARSDAQSKKAAYDASWSQDGVDFDGYIDSNRDQGFYDVINLMNDEYPVLLFPVRLETVFDYFGSGTYGIKIRVFPDQIDVENHDERITTGELDLGEKYWVEYNVTTGTETTRKSAWNTILKQLSPERAAYVVKIAKIIRDETNVTQQQILIKKWTKAAGVPQQPKTRVMPAHFKFDVYVSEFLGMDSSTPPKPIYNPYTLVSSKVGNFVPSDLKVGYSIQSDPITGKSGIGRNGGSTIDFSDPSIQWMVDFDQAVAKGMGAKLHIANNYYSQPENLYKVMVYGLRTYITPQQGQKAIEDLINSHHYSVGFSILKQGTATNNTDEKTSGYSKYKLDPEDTRLIEVDKKIVGPSTDNPVYALQTVEKRKSDSQILAEALGIEYSVFEHIQNANSLDINNSVRMHNVMYSGLGGRYYTNYLMMSPYSTEIDLAMTNYIVKHVSGRGFLPSVRAGNVPYGILPYTDFTKLTWPDHYPDKELLNQLKRAITKIGGVFDGLGDVKQFAGAYNAAYAADDMFSDIVGKHAVSQEFYARDAVSPAYVINKLLFEGKVQEAISYATAQKQFAQDLLNNNGLNLNSGSDIGFDRIPKILQYSYVDGQRKITTPVVDKYPVTPDDKISNIDGCEMNYIHWMRDATIEQLMKEQFAIYDGVSEDVEKPNTMLYKMMRQSVMMEYWNLAADLLNLSLEERKDPDFVFVPTNEGDTPNIEQLDGFEDFQTKIGGSKWEYFDMELTEVPDGGSNTTVRDYIESGRANELPRGVRLLEIKEDLGILAELPGEELDLLTKEIFDVYTDRFDSWKLSMIEERLRHLRFTDTVERKKGCHIGAYGWVHNLKQKVDPALSYSPYEYLQRPVNSNFLPTSMTGDKRNEGFIMAPSLSHAATAAFLRSTYKQKSSDTDPERFAVNLSSSRIRNAKKIIQGVNNGQDLSSLIGFFFERDLGDTDPSFNAYLQVFRGKYPYSTITEGIPGAPIENAVALQVVDGLKLVSAYREHGTDFFTIEFGNGEINSGHEYLITEVLKRTDDLLDAVGDLSVAEGAFNIIQGNPERASITGESIASNKQTPESTIIQTPRSGTAITNKATIHFNCETLTYSSNYTSTLNWKDLNANNASSKLLSYAIEPSLNAWIASMLPSPTVISCKVVFKLPNDTLTPVYVKLSDLGISPMDYLLASKDNLENDFTELTDRIKFEAQWRNRLLNGSINSIHFNEGNTQFTFFDVHYQVKQLKKLVTQSRELSTSDYINPYLRTDTEIFNTTELESRITHFKGQRVPLLLSNLAEQKLPITQNPGYVIIKDCSNNDKDAFKGDKESNDSTYGGEWVFADFLKPNDEPLNRFGLSFTEGTYISGRDEIEAFAQNQFTIECWLRLSNDSLDGGDRILFEYFTDDTKTLIEIFRFSVRPTLILFIMGGEYDTGISFNPDQLYYLSISRENDQFKVYLDGNLLADIEVQNASDLNSISGGNFFTYIGGSPNLSSILGFITDFKVWNFARNETFIQDFLALNPSVSEVASSGALALYYPMNDLEMILEKYKSNIIEASLFADKTFVRPTLPNNLEELIEYLKEEANVIHPILANKIEGAPETDLPAQSKKYVESVSNYFKYYFGDGFKILPQFKVSGTTTEGVNERLLKQMAEVNQVQVYQNQLLEKIVPQNPGKRITDWLQNASLVRDKIKSLCIVNSIADVIVPNFTKVERANEFAMQLPYFDELKVMIPSLEVNVDPTPIVIGDRWMADKFSDKYEAEQVRQKLLSYNRNCFAIQSYADNTDLFSGWQIGIMVDEWTELIPLKEETAGLAFHYNQPQSKAPQALILAVTPVLTGYWDTDDIKNLLLDVFKMANIRQVDYEDLKNTYLGQFGPGFEFANMSYQESTLGILRSDVF